MSKETEALNQFGAMLIRRVRDKTIRHWDMVLDGRMKDSDSQRVRELVASFDPQQLAALSRILPRVVDTTLHYLLWTLEQEDWIRIVTDTEEGLVANLAEASENFPGELYTPQGWISRFTEQRYEEEL